MQRHSGKRDAILCNLRARKDHPTADMIYADMREIYPDISLGTVYRNLSDLCSSGLIIKIGSEGSERYDGDISYHTHFFCNECGGVADVFSALTLSGKEEAEKETGGRLDSVNISLRGVCKNCLQKSKNKIN